MEPTLWTSWNADRSSVRQVWFPGAHADVGGGYQARGLADGPLRWMWAEAAHCGLSVRHGAPTDSVLVLHQERTGGRKFGAFVSFVRGEGARNALSSYADLSEQMLGSFDIDSTACHQLLNPIAQIAFTGGNEKEGKDELKKIDAQTFKRSSS